MFTISGMKFYGNPEVNNMVYSYPDDGTYDHLIPKGYVLLDKKGHDAIRTIQAVESMPSKEQLSENALTERDKLLAMAAIHIAPLQDSIDLGSATEAEAAKAKEWKLYRIDLNGIAAQGGFPETIEWPVAPGGV